MKPGIYFRITWALAVHTWREGMRKKTLLGFLLLSILVIFGSNVVATVMPEMPGAANIGADMGANLIKDICVTAISIFGALITIYISATVLPSEVENRVVYTTLTKPLSRFQYLLGKFLGAQLIIVMNLVLMGALFFTAIYFRQGLPPTLLLWSVFLTYLEFLVVSALTFAVAATASSSVLPIIAGLFIYLTGQLTEYLRGVIDRAALADTFADRLVGGIAQGLYYVLPNLQNFSIRTQVVYSSPNDPLIDVYVPNLLSLSLLYGLAGFFLAYWVYRRKEV